ncbi:MAG: S1C family serine protease [Candidatus Helarchaeota archaeon]
MIIFILLYLCGCYSPIEIKTTPKKSPIIVNPEKTAGILFKRVIIEIPPGKEIGGQYTGLANIKRSPYYWQSSISIGPEIFNEIVNDELTNAGYKVIGGEHLLFDDFDSHEADYLLGAKIQDLEFNTYDSVSWHESEGYVKVQWQLYDKNLRRIIYKYETEGSSKIKEKGGTECLFLAFRIATRNLLANKHFVNNLVFNTDLGYDFENQAEIVLIEKVNLQDIHNKARLLNRAIESVVTIRVEYGHASGVIISEKGYIVTNYHVIEGRNIIDVILSNGITLKANIIKVNQEYDLALLKIEGSGFKALPLGDSSKVELSEDIYAIGTPVLMELGQTVTKGIVSGKRKYKQIEYFQIDADINPGNSGGPVINEEGKIIGIVIMKIKDSEGLGFCIPINLLTEKLGIKISGTKLISKKIELVTIHLKDGSLIKGKIAKENGEQLIFKTSLGLLSFKRKDIIEIVRDKDKGIKE